MIHLVTLNGVLLWDYGLVYESGRHKRLITTAYDRLIDKNGNFIHNEDTVYKGYIVIEGKTLGSIVGNRNKGYKADFDLKKLKPAVNRMKKYFKNNGRQKLYSMYNVQDFLKDLVILEEISYYKFFCNRKKGRENLPQIEESDKKAKHLNPFVSIFWGFNMYSCRFTPIQMLIGLDIPSGYEFSYNVYKKHIISNFKSFTPEIWNMISIYTTLFSSFDEFNINIENLSKGIEINE